MPCLAGEHRDLSTMVRIMRNQISKKASHIRAKAFDAPVRFQRRLQNFPECRAARVQRLLCLRWCHREAVQLLRDSPLRRLQPHIAHVVHMRHHPRDVAPLSPGRLRAPSFARQTVEQVLVDATVRIKSRKQSFGKNIRGRWIS